MRSSSSRPGKDPHGWNRKHNYFAAHFGHIASLLREGFLVEDRLSIDVSAAEALNIEGELICQHGLVVKVAKLLRTQGDQVRTARYTYHAAFAVPHRPIFRYDNAHPRPDHPDQHHKHLYEPPGCPEPGRVVWVGYDGWPSLYDVVHELQEWWEETGQFLSIEDLPGGNG